MTPMSETDELVARLRASIAQLDAGNAADELTRLQAELAAVKAKGDALAGASRLFLHYDGHDDSSGVEMMLNYDNALTAARAAIAAMQESRDAED